MRNLPLLLLLAISPSNVGLAARIKAANTVLHMQSEVAVLVRDYAGSPVEHISITGSIRRGKGAGAGDLTFVSKGQGMYTASVSGIGLSLGTHQCALIVLPDFFCE